MSGDGWDCDFCEVCGRVIPCTQVRCTTPECAEARFFCRFNDGDFGYVLVDGLSGKVVGTDVAEPEDKLLVRDFRWVVHLANSLASEIEMLKTKCGDGDER